MLETIVSIIRQAGALLLSAHAKERDISSKEGKANFVTKYDIAVQQFLQQRLQAAFPSAAFLGEEGGASQLKKSGDTFIVDPIDGTTNFITDYRHSSISIGLARDGQMYAGAVYNPYLDEVFSAKKGEGAFLNGARICCGNRPLCEGTVGFGTSPYHPDLCDATFDLLKALYRASLDIRRSGSAALDICYVACGRQHAYLEQNLKPWDYSGASIILREAGGVITDWGNKELPYLANSDILACVPQFREILLKLINA